MSSTGSSPPRIDRRAFLGRALRAGAALSLGSSSIARAASGPFGAPSAAPPNILVILVDQMRAPCWWPSSGALPHLLPNLARLRQGAVSFGRHYTAANDCTPARATLVTGLHTHQTGCMITNLSDLQPGFPTYGRMLREQGYRTWWYGKWHLS
jgi:arylsulfatase A-like enzyme